MLLSLISAAALFVADAPQSLESITDNAVATAMREKRIPGMSVAIVLGNELIFAKERSARPK